MVYKCGDKPGVGHYECTNCGEEIFLNDAYTQNKYLI